MSWLNTQGTIFNEAGRRILSHPLEFLVDGAGLAVWFILFVMLGWGWVQGEQALRAMLPEPHLVVFMAPETGRGAIQTVWDQLAAAPEVRQFRSLSPQEGLDALRNQSGFAKAIGNLDHNPLPQVFVVYLRQPDETGLEAMTATISAWPRVARIRGDVQWAHKLDRVVGVVRLSCALGGMFVIFIQLVATLHRLRQNRLRSAQQNRLLIWLGASFALVRQPWAFQEILTSGLGICMGLGGFCLLWNPATTFLPLVSDWLGVPLTAQPPSLDFLLRIAGSWWLVSVFVTELTVRCLTPAPRHP